MNLNYKTIVTTKGAEHIAAALLPNGEKLKITHFAVGSGSDTTHTPDAGQTALVHEEYRGSVSNIYIDTEDATRIIVEGIIPADQGGFWVREIGLFNAQGELVVVGNTPEGYKPLPSEGAARVMNCQVFVVVSDTDAIELKVQGDAFLPDATTEKRGLTILSSETNSDDETKAATPKAVNEVRKQLPAVATDIRDRTSGRVALPGMFGYGALFSSSDRTEFKSGTDFLRWVKTAKPGRYTVFADTNVVVPGIQTNGVIEIIWPQPKTSLDDEHAYKVIIYYGVNGHIYYNRYAVSSNGGYLVGWENLKVDEASLIAQIEARAPLKSPALTGTPTAPTPPDDAAGTEIANAEFVRKLLATLVDSSPEALDTLNELAAALGNDPNFATTITNALAGKQPLNDVLTAVSQITPEENTLPYFSAEGRILLAKLSEKARSLLALDTPEAMRTELELKAAATMEPQSDIRDRTPGRLALSGMHGFGQAFTSTEALAFEGLSDFVEWLKKVTPGRYAVSITDSSQLLTGTTQFNGIIDVMWSPYANSESDTVRKFKTLMCYNQYYQGEHCIHYMQYRYNGSDNSWNMSSQVVVYDGDSLAYLLSRMAGSGSYFKYPAVGVPVLAVYRGTTSGDKEIKIGLGDVVQGSQLGGVNLSCTISSAGPGSYGSTPSAGATGYTFPGRYMALSGVRDSYGTSGRICLFVRIE